MFVTGFEALSVALLAIVPGYITIFFWSRNKMWRGLTNDLQTVLKAIAISAALQVAVAPYTLLLLYPVRTNLAGYPWLVLIWLVLLVFLLPYAAGTLTGKATDWLEEKAQAPKAEQSRRIRLLLWLFPEAAPPSVWDSIFMRDPPKEGWFLILEFKDGSRVAGAYGDDSEVYQAPELHGIYLEQEWTLDADGNVDKKIPNTDGVMVADVSDLRCVRFLRGGENEQKEASTEASTEQREETGKKAADGAGATSTTTQEAEVSSARRAAGRAGGGRGTSTGAMARKAPVTSRHE